MVEIIKHFKEHRETTEIAAMYNITMQSHFLFRRNRLRLEVLFLIHEIERYRIKCFKCSIQQSRLTVTYHRRRTGVRRTTNHWNKYSIYSLKLGTDF